MCVGQLEAQCTGQQGSGGGASNRTTTHRTARPVHSHGCMMPWLQHSAHMWAQPQCVHVFWVGGLGWQVTL